MARDRAFAIYVCDNPDCEREGHEVALPLTRTGNPHVLVYPCQPTCASCVSSTWLVEMRRVTVVVK